MRYGLAVVLILGMGGCALLGQHGGRAPASINLSMHQVTMHQVGRATPYGLKPPIGYTPPRPAPAGRVYLLGPNRPPSATAAAVGQPFHVEVAADPVKLFLAFPVPPPAARPSALLWAFLALLTAGAAALAWHHVKRPLATA